MVTDVHLKLGLGPALGALALGQLRLRWGSAAGQGGRQWAKERRQRAVWHLAPGTSVLLAIVGVLLRIGRQLALRIAIAAAALLIAARLYLQRTQAITHRDRSLQPSAALSARLPLDCPAPRKHRFAARSPAAGHWAHHSASNTPRRSGRCTHATAMGDDAICDASPARSTCHAGMCLR